MLLEKDAYITVNIPPAHKTGYVDLKHLRQCLGMYHSGILDDIDLERLWMRCEDLVPGNPLAGLLDSVTLRKCLFTLPEQHRTAIALYYEPLDTELQQQLIHWFVQTGDVGQTYAEYLQQTYCDGLLMLSEVVYRAI